MAKSAACVGLVAALASGIGVDGLASEVGRDARAAAKRAGQSCLRAEPCWRAGVGALASGAAVPAPEAPVHRPKAARAVRPAGA